MSEREEQYGRSLREVYAQYKHLDALFSDPAWMGRGVQSRIRLDLWRAIKAAVAESEREENYEEQMFPSPDSEPVTPRLRELLPRLLDERERKGIETYGRSLETWNGMDVHQDIKKELVDALQYNEQAAMERADLVQWLREALELAEWAIGNMADWNRELHAAMLLDFQAIQEKAAKALPPDAKF